MSLSEVNGSYAMFSLLPALKQSHKFTKDILQESLTKHSGNPIQHYAPCTWNLYSLRHFYVYALLEFLRIFSYNSLLSVRLSHKLHSVAANYHVNSIQPIPVTLPRTRDTQGCLCFYGTSQSHKPGGTPPRIWVARFGRIAQRSFTQSETCESQKCEMECVISYCVVKGNCLHRCQLPESLLPGYRADRRACRSI
jgi:hypothetical protein